MLYTGDIHEEILALGLLLSQLVIRSQWKGPTVHLPIVTSILFGTFKIFSCMRLPAVTSIRSKLLIDTLLCPAEECKKHRTIQHYSTFSGTTGITNEKTLPIFPENVNKHSTTSDETFPETFNSLLQSNCDHFDVECIALMQEATDFAYARNWLDNYTEGALYMALFSALGKLSTTMLWTPTTALITSISKLDQDSIARYTSDIAITMLHFCRIKNTRPILSNNDKKRSTTIYYNNGIIKPFQYPSQTTSPLTQQTKINNIKM